jgi:hypothetical protein
MAVLVCTREWHIVYLVRISIMRYTSLYEVLCSIYARGLETRPMQEVNGAQ